MVIPPINSFAKETPPVNTTLADNVHRLAREHKTTHIDPVTKKVTYPTEMSLFEQLRTEQASGRRGGATSGSGSRSPIALAAVMLWHELQEAPNTNLIKATGKDWPEASPEQKLDLWVRSVYRANDSYRLEQCLKLTTAWINSIVDLLNPEPTIEIKGACPACRETHSWTLVDGEYLRNAALTATVTGADCRACGARWPQQDFQALAASIGQQAAA